MEISQENLENYKKIQTISKNVLQELSIVIKAGSSERAIESNCTQLLQNYGITKTWYYNVPSLIYVGERTLLSMSGKNYSSAELAIKKQDVVTVALSPILNGCWGALARSFIVHDKTSYDKAHVEEYAKMVKFQYDLHQQLTSFAKPSMTFENLYYHFNNLIDKAGYKNLDYHGNLGHSIETALAERKFIEQGNTLLLNNHPLFAFESHLGKIGVNWATKHENVYYFKNGHLVEL